MWRRNIGAITYCRHQSNASINIKSYHRTSSSNSPLRYHSCPCLLLYRHMLNQRRFHIKNDHRKSLSWKYKEQPNSDSRPWRTSADAVLFKPVWIHNVRPSNMIRGTDSSSGHLFSTFSQKFRAVLAGNFCNTTNRLSGVLKNIRKYTVRWSRAILFKKSGNWITTVPLSSF